MADPLSELAGPPRRKPRTKVWAERGVAKDAAEARKRVAASRRTRRRPEPKAPLNVNVRAMVAQAVEAISDRTELSRAYILKRFIEDGIRKYGNTDEKMLAGVLVEEDKTFNPLPPQHPEFTIHERTHTMETRPLPGYAEDIEAESLTAPANVARAIGMSAGMPLDVAQALTEVKDESTDGQSGS